MSCATSGSSTRRGVGSASVASKLDYIASGYTNSAPITKEEGQFLRALLKFHQDYMRPGVLRQAG